MGKTLQFLAVLILALIATFGIHILVLFLVDEPLFSNQIGLCYAVNFLLAAFIYVVIQQTFKNNSTIAGFVFMAGSFVKFIIFFLVFYPIFQQDEMMQTSEFATFFVPYAVCLAIEVVVLSKQLNNQTYSAENSEEPPTENS
ncbi:MAG TPA: hypothetical protein DEA82_03820 [Flavobacteriaceae bacterium]|nr:hypothetical protein [Flavobacteriaceae bacterium]MAY53302.1 hypothetical protein [Flavobacteriaceae bacterium]HBR53346.1 hypothetical protein [Flavobacteriaceae bacterium]